MKYFNSPISIMLSSEIISLAKEFSLAVAETVNYSDSNQYTKNKIANDHFISKLGEAAVAKAFSDLGHIVEGPDFTIYLGDYKSWDADLKIDGTDLAVKTQTTSNAEKYGLSWTFQYSDKRRDPILMKPDAWVIFTECNDLKNYECKVYPPKQIKELILKEPKLNHLIGKKKVYYLEQ